MTLDQAVASASTQLDAILERRWDAIALKMIEDGADPADVADDGPTEGPWARISFDATLRRQKQIDLEWRDGVLAELRANLIAEAG